MSFLRFFIFNLLGNVLPILVAVVAFPTIAHFAGLDRMGVLTVVWSFLGYFGFLDFGLSRVVTRRVALAAARGKLDAELVQLRGFALWYGLPALVVITLALYLLKFAFARWFPVGALGQEFSDGWLWLAICVPITLVTNWLRGALEGVERFARVNLLRTVFGAWNYAGPAVTVLYAPRLDAMIASLVIGRFLAMLGHFLACVQSERGIVLGPAPRVKGAGAAFIEEGGWITISNLIGPLMVYSDRLVLAAMLSPAIVAVYATTQEVVFRVSVIPAALAGALFPRFSGVGDVDPDSAPVPLYQRSIRLIAAIMLPLCVFAAVASYDALSIWLGKDFSIQGYRVVGILAIGIFINSIAYFPFAWLQGSGRSQTIASLHLLQLPVYAVALYLAAKYAGVEGAAWVWSGRLTVDCIMLLVMATRRQLGSALLIAGGGGLVIYMVGLLAGPMFALPWRVASATCAVVLSVLSAWFLILNREDRHEIVSTHSLA